MEKDFRRISGTMIVTTHVEPALERLKDQTWEQADSRRIMIVEGSGRVDAHGFVFITGRPQPFGVTEDKDLAMQSIGAGRMEIVFFGFSRVQGMCRGIQKFLLFRLFPYLR